MGEGVCFFCLSGGVKFNYSMGIHKGCSMDIFIIEAISQELMSMGDSSDIMDESELKELETQGFYVQKFSF